MEDFFNAVEEARQEYETYVLLPSVRFGYHAHGNSS